MKQLPLSLTAVIFVLALSTGIGRAAQSPKNPFGVHLPKGEDAAIEQIARAKEMQAAYLRPFDITVEDWNRGKGKCADCERFKKSGMKLILTIRNSGRAGEGKARVPSTPPRDFFQFRKGVAEILLAYAPVLIAVENEEDSPQSYFDGTKHGVWDSAEDGRDTVEKYAEELHSACEVAHKLSSRCTNGGISSRAAALLTWGNYIKLGRNAEACDFAKRAFYSRWNSDEGEKLCKVNSLDTIPPEPRKEIAQYKRLLDVYRSAKIDYVNFHWYIHDAKILEDVVRHLRISTSKPVITNEMGLASWDSEPNKAKELLQSAEKLGMPYIVWSGEESEHTNFAQYRQSQRRRR